MQTADRSFWKSRRTLARPLLALVVGLEMLHIAVVLLLPRPMFASNVLQLCFPLLIVAVSLQQSLSSTTRVGKHLWYTLASAFAIWATAQALFLYYLRVPCTLNWGGVRPDDALWLLFGLPLLLGITTTHNDIDKVSWLDRFQAILFIAVLYCMVFLPNGHLGILRAYLIQNLALVLCCFLRFPACTLARERRFFTRLMVFLVVYASMECLGDTLYHRGWPAGTALDLVWTLPQALLLILILRDATHAVQGGGVARSYISKTMRTMQGLSVAAMAFLSMAVAAMLARTEPLVGGLFVAVAFTLFALRTNLREKLWNDAHDRLQATVLQDALTGLGNRLHLQHALEERLLSSDPASVVLLFADLDRFKQVNDSLGHAMGDRALIEVGRRLRMAAAPGSVVCRLGGDEFVVISSAPDLEGARAAGEQLLEALQAPFLLGKQEFRCTASIGVVQAVAGQNADELLRAADHAMYHAKQVGRDRVQIFDTALYADLNSRRRMEHHLRAAMADKSIQVAFQPIYSVELGGICGFEALARWSHPELGNVPPVEFITLAERSGLIIALGAQILETACQQIATWNRAWGTELTVAVNVSAHQFADAALLPFVLEVLERTGLTASLLRLEITETALLVDQAVVRQTLEQARSLGIRISLDDFGTGYSSLSFLLSLPVDEVKVDRSFVSHMVQDAKRRELVRTVVHLGHTLGKSVVAEGVETEQELLTLAEMGCECVQGYYISKPLSPEAVEADLSAMGLAVSSFHPAADTIRSSHARLASAASTNGLYARPPEQQPPHTPTLPLEVANSC